MSLSSRVDLFSIFNLNRRKNNDSESSFENNDKLLYLIGYGSSFMLLFYS